MLSPDELEIVIVMKFMHLLKRSLLIFVRLLLMKVFIHMVS